MWPFSRFGPRRVIEISDKEFRSLVNNLKNSFINIKRDVTDIQERLQNHDDKLGQYGQKIIALQENQTRIEGAFNGISKINIQPILPEQKEPKFIEISDEIKTKLWDNLTNVQKTIILRLNILLKEGNQEWIPLKYLAQELYPDKDYNIVKPMLSSYTNILSDLGLINKRRKGREIYLTNTKRSAKYLPKNIVNQLKIKRRS